MEQPASPPDDEVLRVLDALNTWERTYGTSYGPGAELDALGEGTARIAQLKERLKALGAVFHWAGEGYVLDGVRSDGPGEERRAGPERPDAP